MDLDGIPTFQDQQEWQQAGFQIRFLQSHQWHKVTDQLMPAMPAMAMKMKISLRGAWGRRGLQRRVQTFAALDSEMHGIF